MADASVEVRGIDELIRRLNAYPRLVMRAQRRAVDKTATRVRRAVVDGIVAETTIKKAAVNRRVRVLRRSTQTNAEAVVGISRSPIPITEFKPETKRRTVAVRADISTQPGVGVELIRKSFKPIGHPKRDIFERVRRGGERVKRYPIVRSTGPSAGLMVQPLMPEIIERGSDFLRATMLEEFGKEVRRVNARQ